MLKHLQLRDFRNHAKLDLEFGKVTILIGPNGAGKTNVVEAIRLVSLLKSFRARSQKELIKWEGQAARVIGKTAAATVEVALTPQQKIIKINGVRKPNSEAIGIIPTVLFAPEDVALLAGPPAARRRFLDSMLVQRDRNYLVGLVNYQQVLRQRNAALDAISRGLGGRHTLQAWDSQLIELAGIVQTKRKVVVQTVNQSFAQTYQKVSGSPAMVVVEPKWSAISLEGLAAVLDRDIALASTTLGPHHDDFSVTIDGQDIGRFGSRGENRTAVVALKLAEFEYLGEDSVLLLDDIFSELDHNRRERLQQLVQNYQTIITTTDEHYISSDLMKTAKIIQLQQP